VLRSLKSVTPVIFCQITETVGSKSKSSLATIPLDQSHRIRAHDCNRCNKVSVLLHHVRWGTTLAELDDIASYYGIDIGLVGVKMLFEAVSCGNYDCFHWLIESRDARKVCFYARS
jgi:hypothetical protein